MDPRYPVGRTRLETVGVILCAVIMALSSTEVVQSSVVVLWDALSTGVSPFARHCCLCLARPTGTFRSQRSVHL